MFDKMLIKYCSPTLGGLKTANLFNYTCYYDKEMYKTLFAWNKVLNAKGISLNILHKRGNKYLIYVYRNSMLACDLRKNGVEEFLMQYDYQEFSITSCIEMLKQRIVDSACFPHEIGLFLGYPLVDVKGFIDNSGKNCKLSGDWKVYGDKYEAINQFERFNKCKKKYRNLYENRIQSIFQLTVAV